MAPITIAIAGGTGLLGNKIARTALSSAYYPKEISRVVVFTRDPSSAAAQKLKVLGAEVLPTPETADKLKGADVLVNALGGRTTIDEANALAQAAFDAGVKVYFPSEYGFDHRHMKGVANPVFEMKAANEDFSRKLGLKVICVDIGLFIDTLFYYSPYLGFDPVARKFTTPGSTTVRTPYVHSQDIASSVVRLSVMATADPNSVPDHVFLHGDHISVQEQAELLEKISGKKYEVESIDPVKFKEELPADNFTGWLRLCIGQGRDFTGKHHNELVNPGESLWKWATFETFLNETYGKEWN